MMPSRSDRRAWPAFLLDHGRCRANLVTIGLDGPAHQQSDRSAATTVFGYLGLALSMAIGVNIFFMAIIAALEGMIGRVKGVSVVYSSVEAPEGTNNVTI